MFLLVGIAPLRSAKSARWMQKHLYGTIIPEAYVERLEGAADPAAEGERICVELIEELAAIPGVAGVHVMAPANEAAVPARHCEARQRASFGTRRPGRWTPVGSSSCNTRYVLAAGLPELSPRND